MYSEAPQLFPFVCSLNNLESEEAESATFSKSHRRFKYPPLTLSRSLGTAGIIQGNSLGLKPRLWPNP